MPILKNNIPHLSFGIVLGIALAIGLSVLAFTEPTDNPPGGNVLAPLNTGAAGQQKLGGLVLGVNCILPNCTTGLIVQNGNVGIGTTGPVARLDVQGFASGSTGLRVLGSCKIKVVNFLGV